MAFILVTGGTGFIGRHLVERLVERGERVRCLVRRFPLRPISNVEYVAGDILHSESLGPALENVETVYHLAGATRVCSVAEYALHNEQGSANLAAACANQVNPPRVVYVSSLAAAGPAKGGRPLSETDPTAPVSAYGRSKLAGEEHFRAVADRVPVTVVRPPSVFGPGDPHTLVLFRTVRWRVHMVPGWQDVTLSWLYVDDLVTGLLLAAERGHRLQSTGPDVLGEKAHFAGGTGVSPVLEKLDRRDAGPTGEQGFLPSRSEGIYFLAGEETASLSEIGKLAAGAMGRKLLFTLHVPALLCRAFGRTNDAIARLLGRPQLLSSDKIREGLAGSWLCSADKAKGELGFAARIGLAEGFRRTVEWYRAEKWL